MMLGIIQQSNYKQFAQCQDTLCVSSGEMGLSCWKLDKPGDDYACAPGRRILPLDPGLNRVKWQRQGKKCHNHSHHSAIGQEGTSR